MIIKQLSIFLQNQAGRLSELIAALAQNDINISAISIAENAEYGVIRMIVSDTEKAAAALKAKDFSVKLTNVICIQIPDEPGTLHRILALLAAEDINVSYMYGHSANGRTNLTLKVDDSDKAEKILNEQGI